MFKLKNTAAKEKKALLFLLKLLILMCLLKTIFFFYNYRIAGGWSVQNVSNAFDIFRWSLLYDFFIITLVNLPLFLFVLPASKALKNGVVAKFMAGLWAVLNSIVILLNSIDIFYFRFHMQRADADLFYVLRNPFKEATPLVWLLILAAVAFFCVFLWLIYTSIISIINSRVAGNIFLLSNVLLCGFAILFIVTGTKKLLPTYPLTQLEAVQLPLSQNSFHCFLYSLCRLNESAIPAEDYMPLAEQKALFSIHKKNDTVTVPKNIVLFIMESVPSEFFDSSSPYKVTMPFLDSLVNRSTCFSNAFSYSYNSNKGITAILAGIPTITDIPLYHSNFTAVRKTPVGKILAQKKYHSSFFIGDNYDDFGFAKCCKWLGIQDYYCMEDIPGYRQMEKHSMGLHDEFVLGFMQEKISADSEPFFAVQYNISTHYPNDLPKTFSQRYPANNTPPMKTMQYYNDCLEKFFKDASTKAWYKNSVFIFCSDHWAQPHTLNIPLDMVESFCIPLFIYEPGNEKKQRISAPVSQLDVLNTILYFGGVSDSIISYGENLKAQSHDMNRTIFTKLNSAVYQAINREYVLGFNAIEAKPMYCYNYKKDLAKKNNLLLSTPSKSIDSLVLQMKAFLQTAASHYRNE